MSEEKAIKLRVTGWPGVAVLAISPVWVPALTAGAIAAIMVVLAMVLVCIAFAFPVIAVIYAVEAFDIWRHLRRAAKQ